MLVQVDTRQRPNETDPEEDNDIPGGEKPKTEKGPLIRHLALGHFQCLKLLKDGELWPLSLEPPKKPKKKTVSREMLN